MSNKFYVPFYHKDKIYPSSWLKLDVPMSAFSYDDIRNKHHWNVDWAIENIYPLFKKDDIIRNNSVEQYVGWNGLPDTDTYYHKLFIGAHKSGLYGDEQYEPLLFHCGSMSIPFAVKLISNYGCVYFDDAHQAGSQIPNLNYCDEKWLYLDFNDKLIKD